MASHGDSDNISDILNGQEDLVLQTGYSKYLTNNPNDFENDGMFNTNNQNGQMNNNNFDDFQYGNNFDNLIDEENPGNLGLNAQFSGFLNNQNNNNNQQQQDYEIQLNQMNYNGSNINQINNMDNTDINQNNIESEINNQIQSNQYQPKQSMEVFNQNDQNMYNSIKPNAIINNDNIQLQLQDFMENLIQNGQFYLQTQQGQNKQQLVDFLIESQTLLEETLQEDRINTKFVGLNPDIDYKQTVKHAFQSKQFYDIQQEIFDEQNGQQIQDNTWNNIFQDSIQGALRSVKGKLTSLPIITNALNEKIDLEEREPILSKELTIEPAPKTFVYLITHQMEKDQKKQQKQFPIISNNTYKKILDFQTMIKITEKEKFYFEQNTEIQLVAGSTLGIEETPMYSLKVYPQGYEDAMIRPDHNIAASLRPGPDGSWIHKPEIMNRQPQQTSSVDPYADLDNDIFDE